MESIYIPNLLNAPEHQQTYEVQEHLDHLSTLTPVNGRVQVIHNGNFLEVRAIAETIVTLTCDRCLQQYNHRLQLDLSELIWLEEPSEVDEEGVEIEVPMDDLVETLPPRGYFHPSEWLYEQLCLALPQRQLCDADCSGIAVESTNAAPDTLQPIDQRWASLQVLKENLLN
ncbi:MAG: DUF177 domain-containing protein [Leptolyngbyaceae cyanobacterium]